MILRAQKGPFLCNNPMASHVQGTHPWLAYVSMTFGRWYYKDKRDLSYVITPWLHTSTGTPLTGIRVDDFWKMILHSNGTKGYIQREWLSILKVCPHVDQKLSLSRDCLLNLFHWKKVAVKADCSLIRPTFGREFKFFIFVYADVTVSEPVFLRASSLD